MSGLITAAVVTTGISSGLSAMMGYSADSAKAKAQKAWQAYTNKMVEFSHGQTQNSITTNELLASDALTNQAFQLRKESMFIRGQVEVSAATAGVKGRSVNLAIRQVVGNSAARESERQEAFRTTMLGVDQKRKSAAMNAAMQKDNSYIPKPKAASYYLGAVSKTASTGFSMAG